MSSEKNRSGTGWRQAVASAGLALAIPSMIFVPALVGWYIDKRTNTWPILFLVGLVAGFLSAGVNVYKLLKRFGQFK
jgi:F0F1-type ATP synthase assembly protein I